MHPNFIYAFTVTLLVFETGAVAIFVGLIISQIIQLWRRSKASLRLVQTQRFLSGIANKTRKAITANVLAVLKFAYAVIIAGPVAWFWSLLAPVREAISMIFTREICFGLAFWLILALLPLTAFGRVISPVVETVTGVALAGALIGFASAPIFIWKTEGHFLKRMAAGIGSVVGFSYLALLIFAFLIVGASD